jgi:hydroxyethylthiazole kinase-like uncharacterized protein yjeF
MKIVRVREMRKIDRRAIKGLGIPGVVLMENAGQSVLTAMEDFFDFAGIRKVTIVCGRGNNGGDGFVVARYLMNEGISVNTFIVGDPSIIKGDAKRNRDIFFGLGGKITPVRSKRSLERLRESLGDSDICVDAIFGTGFSGIIRGIAQEVVSAINESSAFIVSVDSPSGIDSDTGGVAGEAIQADLTVTMGLPKVGQLLYPGRYYVGELYIADIGFPEHVIDDVNPMGALVEQDIIQRFLPWRAPNLHKGAFGKALIVSGSTGMSGAAAMSGTSALRAGAGLVYLAIPESLNPILEEKCTEVITIPVLQTKTGAISIDAYEKIMEKVADVDVVAVGPGLSQDPETKKMVRKVVEDAPIPLVIDADGINALVNNTAILKKRIRATIVTPHPGEIARLIKRSVREIEEDRVGICTTYAKRWGVVLVLKGAPTVIAHPDGQYWINSHVNSGLATAGSGDVLTGLIVGFLAQKTSPIAAAVSGVYIHSYAGELLRETKGEHGLIAGDLVDSIPEAIVKTLKEK